jgi:hypothetical protein
MASSQVSPDPIAIPRTATWRAATLSTVVLRAAVLAVVLAGVTVPAWAYIVVLKDGTQITTEGPYVKQGNQVLLTLPSGTQVTYPLADVDLAKTDELNAGTNLTNAKLLPSNKARQVERDKAKQPEKKTFAELFAERSGSLALPETKKRSNAGQNGGEAELPRTSAGFIDFGALSRKPYPDDAVSAEILRYLRQGGEDVRIFAGSAPGRPLVEIVTVSEASVFKALRDAANCLLQMNDRFPGVQGIDLLLLAEGQGRAGQFSLDREKASQLATGEIEPPTFFLRYVEF